MEDSNKIEQGFIIDRLTNSILNTISGDSFQTEVIRLGKSDLKHITKKKGGISIGNRNLKADYRKQPEYYTRNFECYN